MDLTIYFEEIVRNFSSYHKYTPGSELREKSREFVGLLIKANKEVQAMCKKESYVVSVAIVMAIAVMMFFPLTGTAGSLDPGTAPAPTMKTLDQIPPTWDQTLQCDTTACPRFQLVLGGAGVLDKETGLVWEQAPSQASTTWLDALAACQNKNVGNRKGWRLPTVEELASLLDPTMVPPQANLALPSGHPFTVLQTSFGYWSSTTNAAFPDTSAWIVFIADGGIAATFVKTGNRLVWCVRGGQGYDGK
jgi:hypothetical protein